MPLTWEQAQRLNDELVAKEGRKTRRDDGEYIGDSTTRILTCPDCGRRGWVHIEFELNREYVHWDADDLLEMGVDEDEGEVTWIIRESWPDRDSPPSPDKIKLAVAELRRWEARKAEELERIRGCLTAMEEVAAQHPPPPPFTSTAVVDRPLGSSSQPLSDQSQLDNPLKEQP